MLSTCVPTLLATILAAQLQHYATYVSTLMSFCCIVASSCLAFLLLPGFTHRARNMSLNAANDAVEKHLQANKPNQPTGRADTTMDQPENGQAPAEPADETEKADDSVATANARDAVIVNAIMNSPMNSSERTKAVMDYPQSRQASD
ncbi:TPA: hypothetical protein ACH3X1_004168 [Trebouxia sp. C0004]